MSTSDEKWFVEDFHLRSPLEEFEEHGRLEVERLYQSHPKFDPAAHREAIELVVQKLRPNRTGAHS